MPAYLIGTIRVSDQQRWQEYVDRVGATFRTHGARVLFRAIKHTELNGTAHGERVVVAEFDDVEALTRWHDSSDYQQLITLRDSGAEVVLTAYQT